MKNKTVSLKQTFDGLKQKQKKLVRRFIAIGVLLVALIVVELIKLSPSVSEFFAKWVSRPWRTAIGFITSWFAFSIFEVLIIFAVIVGIIFLISLFRAVAKHKKFKIVQKLTSLALIVMSVLTVYTVTAGFDYARPTPQKPWEEIADIRLSEYKNIVFDYARAAGELSNGFNKDQNGQTVLPYTFEEMAKIMQKEVQQYTGGDYGWYAPLPKKVLNGWWLDWTNILGIMFAPTNEVNMNGAIGSLYLPYYMAHEMAHALGIMNEREANLFATYVTLNSSNPYVRYSGYHYELSSLYNIFFELEAHNHNVNLPDGKTEESACVEGGKCPQFSPTLKQVDELLGANYKADFLLPYYTPVAPPVLMDLSRWINDIYLKLSGLIEGTGSYLPGGYEILPPDLSVPDDPSVPDEPVIRYSEIQKIFIYLHKNLLK